MLKSNEYSLFLYILFKILILLTHYTNTRWSGWNTLTDARQLHCKPGLTLICLLSISSQRPVKYYRGWHRHWEG